MLKIADFDNDGDNDIITFADAYVMSFVYMFENQGNNTFNVTNSFNIYEGCSNFIVTDFNNDSLPDALFATYNTEGEYLLYYNLGNFQMGDSMYINIDNYNVSWKNMCCADMDGNLYTDIIITRMVFDTTIAPSIVEILFNDGHGNFVLNPLTSTHDIQLKDKISFNCYPNPFSTNTTFEFTINQTSHIEISIYSLQGKLVKSLTNKKWKEVLIV